MGVTLAVLWTTSCGTVGFGIDRRLIPKSLPSRRQVVSISSNAVHENLDCETREIVRCGGWGRSKSENSLVFQTCDVGDGHNQRWEPGPSGSHSHVNAGIAPDMS